MAARFDRLYVVDAQRERRRRTHRHFHDTATDTGLRKLTDLCDCEQTISIGPFIKGSCKNSQGVASTPSNDHSS